MLRASPDLISLNDLMWTQVLITHSVNHQHLQMYPKAQVSSVYSSVWDHTKNLSIGNAYIFDTDHVNSFYRW